MISFIGIFEEVALVKESPLIVVELIAVIITIVVAIIASITIS